MGPILPISMFSLYSTHLSLISAHQHLPPLNSPFFSHTPSLPTTSHFLPSCLHNTHMASRRRSTVSKEITEDDVKHLISALQALQPELRAKSMNRAAIATVIEAACNDIRRLHREIDGLSEKLAHLLEEKEESDSAGEAEIIRSLLA